MGGACSSDHEGEGHHGEESNADKEHPDNKVLVHEGWTKLTEKDRWCTDILYLFLLIAVWFAMTVVGFIVCGVIQDDHLPKGNPNRLTNSIDFDGNLCGFDNPVKNKPFAYYMLDTSVVCTNKCPKENDFSAFICRYENQAAANNDTVTAWNYVNQGKCMYEIESSPVLNRCFPDADVGTAFADASASANSTGTSLSSAAIYKTVDSNGAGQNKWTYFMASMWDLRIYTMCFGLAGSVIIAFAYLYSLRIPGALFTVVWVTVLLILVCLIVGGALLWSLAGQYAEDGSSQAQVMLMKVLAWICLIGAVIYALMVLVMRSRIMLAIGVIKQASRAMTKIGPALLSLPVIQAFGIAIFLIVLLIYLLYMASSGDIKVTQYCYASDDDAGEICTSYKTFEYTQNQKFAFLFLLFCWFWTSEFVYAWGQIVIAMAFAAWYFTKDKSEIGTGTFLWSLRTSTWYHSGTAAHGSLIIAIIKTIRAVVAYIQKKAKKSGNKIAQYVLCIIQCCLWCLEKCMKFLNKHAYILTAIYNDSFCRAARRAFFLLLRNILRVVAVNMISWFVLMLGHLMVPCVTTFLCYLAIVFTADLDGTWGIVGPLIFVFVLGYWIAGIFMELFGMGIETILFCYIADEEMFSVEDRFADKDLKSSMQKAAEKHAERAAAKAGGVSGKVHPFTSPESADSDKPQPVAAYEMPVQAVHSGGSGVIF